MTILVIKQLGGLQIGTVTQNHDGSLSVKSEDLNHELEAMLLEAMLDELMKEPLALLESQIEQEADGSISCLTIERVCQPGDSHYLEALATATLHKNLIIAGHRVLGYVVKD